MDSQGSGGADPNFDFAFDSRNFSDAVLTIVVDGDDVEEVQDDASPKPKRRREENNVNNKDDESPGDDDEPVSSSHDTEEISGVPRSKSIFVSAAILSAKSLFFYKLFTKSTKEGHHHHATVHINASEEAAFMDLLNYMYSGKLTLTEAPSIVKVLIAADKFGVASCMGYCSKLLLDLPMTLESALLYLDLPQIVHVSSGSRLLIEAAKAYLVARYSDMEKLEREAANLSLVAIEAILCSDDLRAPSEDALYDFVLNWLRFHYPKIEDRSKIFKSHLSHVIRFPFMTCKKLMKALTCDDLDHEDTRKLILEALFFKNGSPPEECDLSLDVAKERRFRQRSYKHHLVKALSFETPEEQCIVYLDLRKEDLASLFPLGQICSQAFRLGGQDFFLSATCCVDQQSEFHCFGLFLHMPEGRSPTVLSVDYEFSARKEPTRAFSSEFREFNKFTPGKTAGCTNLFKIPWCSFMSDGSSYFIGGMLHLRAQLTIRNPQLHLPQQEPHLQLLLGQPFPRLHGPNHHPVQPAPRLRRERRQRQQWFYLYL